MNKKTLFKWHTRYFELKDGVLTWWRCKEDSLAGVEPQRSLKLLGAKAIASKQKNNGITIGQNDGHNDVALPVLELETDDVKKWVASLKAHALYANKMNPHLLGAFHPQSTERKRIQQM